MGGFAAPIQQFSPLALLLAGGKLDPNAVKASAAPTAKADAMPVMVPTPKMPPVSTPAYAPDPGPLPTATPAAPSMPPVGQTPTQTENAAVLARRRGLMEQLAEPAPKREDYKPSFWDRLGGGLSAGLLGFAHNPNAVQVGQGVTERKFNDAMANWETRQAQTQTQAREFDRGEQIRREMQDFALRQGSAERQNRVADSQIERNQAEAERFRAMGRNFDERAKNASPSERAAMLPELEKSLSAPLSKEQRDYFILNGKIPNPEKAQKDDLDPTHVILGSTPEGPARTKKAQELFDKMHREPKDKAEKPKGPMPPNQARLLNDAKDKEIRAARTAHQNGEIGYDEYLDLWQNAQDKFEQAIANAGYDPGEHLDIRSNVNDKGFKKAGTAKPAASAPAQPAKGASPAASRYQVGDVVSIKGKQMKITKLYQDGSFDADLVKGK